MAPTITRIETTEFSYPIEDVGLSPSGFSIVYTPGNTHHRKLFGIRIYTDEGVTGEYVGGNSPGLAQINMVAQYLIGKNAFNRERHWVELKRALRKYDRMGIGPLDVALWDLAGKAYGAPIHEMLGTYRTRIPAYASTYDADLRGGLDSPEKFADFAEACYEQGFRAFKVHGWGSEEWRDLDREIATVHAIGERVGDRMDLMLDPACQFETFADAVKVGRACDEWDFFWYEDPYRDAGISQHGHRKLRQLIDTPLLQTEHVRGLEPKSDFVAAEATDFVRADPEYDGGITGVMKTAHMAEAYGLDVELHAAGPAQRHCIAAIRNTNYYELSYVHPHCKNSVPPVYRDGYRDEFDSIDENGTVGVPEGPGLGVTYDWEFIEKNRTGRRVYE